MDTIKIKKSNTKLIAHRGLSAIETENTNAAFVAAANRTYWGIETDVHMCADGTFAIFHDDSLNRLAGEDRIIEETSFEDLKSIVLKDTCDGINRADLVIPTLSEYIRICKKYEKTAVLEIKNHMQKSDIKRITDIIREHKYLKNTVFISFDFENLVTLREIGSDFYLQYLVPKWNNNLIEKLKKYDMDIDIKHSEITKEIVKHLHKNGILVNCWTVDTIEDAKKMIKCGVDYVTTNILE